MPPLQVQTFALATAAAVPANVSALYSTTGFVKAVRDWHLDRLPRLTVTGGQYLVCPWCNAQKDMRSMQIDHIIPVRVYVRYELFRRLQPTTSSAGEGALTSRARSVLGEAYNDIANLMLCCARCNAGNRNNMPTSADLTQAIGRVPGTQLAAGLARLQGVLTRISNLPTSRGIDCEDWVLNGATWNTAQVRTRGASPYTSRLQAHLSVFERLVIDAFARSRTSLTVTAAQLKLRQRVVPFTNEDHRLCFYCLGLFKKQAFHLDHVHPISGMLLTAANYNNPANLLPVCRTCNTSKNNQSPTTLMLDTFIQNRQNDGEAGVEHSTFPAGAFATNLAHARSHRLRVLGA